MTTVQSRFRFLPLLASDGFGCAGLVTMGGAWALGEDITAGRLECGSKGDCRGVEAECDITGPS